MGKLLPIDFSAKHGAVPRRTGTFCISRDLWKDPFFSKTPMSEREAYIWMTKEASWKPRTVKVAGRVVELQRGQFSGSSRFLADQFKWSEARVRRYFCRLEKRRMIQRTIDAGISVITLLDYEEIQFPIHHGDAGSVMGPTHDRRKQEEIINNIGKGLSETDMIKAPQASASSPTIPELQNINSSLEEHGHHGSFEVIKRLRQAVGLATDHTAAYWCDQSVMSYIKKWRKLGLKDDQIIKEAKASRAKNPEVPNGPKALDRWMSAAVKPMGHKASDPTVPSRTETVISQASKAEQLLYYADLVNSDKYLAPSLIGNRLADELLCARLVTPERLRARGVSI